MGMKKGGEGGRRKRVKGREDGAGLGERGCHVGKRGRI